MIRKDGFLVREEVIDAIRKFFKEKGFREVFTPILVPIPSIEPNLEVFETELKTSKGIKKRGFLIMSPEFSIKKLLSKGIGNCFEITKCFRNEEEVSRLHNPEFTLLEWYRVGADYKNIMKDFENLFLEIIGKDKLSYQGITYDLSLPWPRVSFKEAFKKYASLNVLDVKDEDFYKIFFNKIDPELRKLRKPVILYDYPASQASLAKLKDFDPRFAERFEVFLAGIEFGNAFSELTDYKMQESRFKKDRLLRKKLGKCGYPIDTSLIEALKKCPKKLAGIAVGVDRLIMLKGNYPDIFETLSFSAKDIFDLKG